MTWATDYRMNWIRESILIFGAINRDHIQKKFGVSTPQASVDLRAVQKRWPELMTYDGSAKQYVLRQKAKTMPSEVSSTPISDEALSEMEGAAREALRPIGNDETGQIGGAGTQGNGWQPIKTAPRDGTMILIAFGQDGTFSSFYVANEPQHPWAFVENGGMGKPIYNKARDDKYGPTHWMPLPNAPARNHGADVDGETLVYWS